MTDEPIKPSGIDANRTDAPTGRTATLNEDVLNVMTRLAYRTLWLAFRWNDHNFKAAHIEAREACARIGIVTDDQADEWLEHGKLPPIVLRDAPSELLATIIGPEEYEADINRHYLPLPGGWEIQTKGSGSTFRMAFIKECEVFERWAVLDRHLHAPLEKMARDIRRAVAELVANAAPIQAFCHCDPDGSMKLCKTAPVQAAVAAPDDISTAWLIERLAAKAKNAMWWTGGGSFSDLHSDDGWTSDANLAIKFADAPSATASISKQLVLDGIHSVSARERFCERVTITEHMFLSAPSAPEQPKNVGLVDEQHKNGELVLERLIQIANDSVDAAIANLALEAIPCMRAMLASQPADNAAKENAVREAQQWSMEAKAQRATVLSILEYFGLPAHDYEALRLIKSKIEAQPAAPDNVARPDLIENLTYHAHERDDMTIDELLQTLSKDGYRKVRQRTHRQLELQLLSLLSSQPAAPVQCHGMETLCSTCNNDRAKCVYAAPVEAATPAQAMTEDMGRLDFMVGKTAWIQWRLFDDTFKRCQLMTQDEDENFICLSGEDKYFGTPREAIDAAIAAKREGA